MKVRPIFWYLLAAALVLGFALGGARHMLSIAQLRSMEDLPMTPSSAIMVTATDTVDFVAELARMSGDAVTLARFTAENAPSGGSRCQITATGAYNELAAFLSQLEAAPSVRSVDDFVLSASSEEEALTLTVEVTIN